MHFYLDESREGDPWALPNAEVFFAQAGEWEDGEGEPNAEGWFWWPCFPGCMPDGEATGPYASAEEAIEDARRVFE